MAKQWRLPLVVLSLLLSAETLWADAFQLRVEPQPAQVGENLTLVISGAACAHFFSPAELSTGAATTIHGFECLAPPTPFTTRVPLGALPYGDYIARALGNQGELAGETEFSVELPGKPLAACMPDDDTLCLRGGRFRVEASLRDPQLVDRWGAPRVRLLSFEGGAFYFFSSSNPELFVKVLDGCGYNGHYWLFVSGLTNLGVTLRVRDMQTGQERVIENPQGRAFVSVQDTAAFACGS